MTEQCSGCRFWLIDEREKDLDEELPAWRFGWCRRHPPVIVDHMARQAIPPVGFGGHNFDPENIAPVRNVHPATFGTQWCGEHALAREA